ncbi:MAG: hypothetical protein ACOC0V_00280 [Oceanicaulis sp.]
MRHAVLAAALLIAPGCVNLDPAIALNRDVTRAVESNEAAMKALARAWFEPYYAELEAVRTDALIGAVRTQQASTGQPITDDELRAIQGAIDVLYADASARLRSQEDALTAQIEARYARLVPATEAVTRRMEQAGALNAGGSEAAGVALDLAGLALPQARPIIEQLRAALAGLSSPQEA